MIGVNEREVEVDIQIEYLAEAPLAGQNDAGKLEKGKQAVSNFGLGVSVLPLEGKDGLEDDCLGDPGFDVALLNSGEVSCASGGLLRVVLEEMAEENVGV